MSQVNLIKESVLILNKYYLAVQVTEAKDAVSALVAGKAKVIDEFYNIYDLINWINFTEQRSFLVQEQYAGLLHSPSTTILVPQVILFPSCEYTSPLIKTVKYSRKNIFQRDNYTCQYCSKRFDKKDLNIDHIVPRSRGGPNSWKNIVTSCISCNARKGDKLITELGWTLVQEPKEPKWRSHIGRPFSEQKRIYWERFLK